jgi:hypothetical protein
MPAVFRKLGLSFTYPENWSLDEGEALEGNRSVAVYSPGGSFWSVSIHPSETRPHDLVKAAIKALRETYDELDTEEIEDSMAGRRLVGADVNFYCLDLTNTAVIRSFAAPNYVCLVLSQADDREFSAIANVFKAMTLSLLNSFDAAGPAGDLESDEEGPLDDGSLDEFDEAAEDERLDGGSNASSEESGDR